MQVGNRYNPVIIDRETGSQYESATAEGMDEALG
jgi:hypothetical protein